jgi:hypothetical protein
LGSEVNPLRNLLAARLVLSVLFVGALVFLFASHGFAAPWVFSFTLLVAIARAVVSTMYFRRRRKLLREHAGNGTSGMTPSELAAGIRRQRIFLAAYCLGFLYGAIACVVLAAIFPDLDPVGYILGAIFIALIVTLVIVSEIAIRRRLSAASG